MPTFKDWVAGRTVEAGGDIVDADEFYLRDDSGDVSKRVTYSGLKTALDERYVSAFLVSGYGATGDGTTDDTTAIQAALDAAEAAGGGVVYAPPGTYRFSTLDVGDAVWLKGAGPGATVFKFIDGINLFDSGYTGTYAISAKTGITSCAMSDFEIDGNYTAFDEYAAGEWDDAFDESDGLVRGRVRSHGIATSSVAPDLIVLDNLYVHDTVRSCFLLQMGAGRSDYGVVLAGHLRGANSALDHIFYADNATTLHVSSLACEGFACDGMVTTSGAKFGSVTFSNLIPNPNENTTIPYNFETRWLVDDRNDVRGSVFGSISASADFTDALGGTDLTRCLYHSTGFGPVVGAMQLHHSGGVDDTLRVFTMEGTSGAPQTQHGPMLRAVTGTGMPSGVRLFSHDPSAYGGNLFGGSVSDCHLLIANGAAASDTALFEFRGRLARGFRASAVSVISADFGTAGPSQLFEDSTTTDFADISFDGIYMPHASPSNNAFDNSGAGTTSRIHVNDFYSPAKYPSATPLVQLITNSSVDGKEHAPPATTVGNRNGWYWSPPGTRSTMSVLAERGYFQQLPVFSTDQDIDRIAINVTGAGGAGSVTRLGIYSSFGTVYVPGPLVLDAGTVDTSTSGVKEITIDQTLAAGRLYYLVLVAQVGTSPTYRSLSGTSTPANAPAIANSANSALADVGHPGIITLGSWASGALPASATTPVNLSNGNRVPVMTVRWST